MGRIDNFLKEYGIDGGVYKISTKNIIEIIQEWDLRKHKVTALEDVKLEQQWGDVKQRLFGRDFSYHEKDNVYSKDGIKAVVIHNPIRDTWGLIVLKDQQPMMEKINLSFYALLNLINKL
jgi:hypothetical protein